jgi:hypothetical protein
MAEVVTPPTPPSPGPEDRKPWTTPRLVTHGTLAGNTHVDSVSGLPA